MNRIRSTLTMAVLWSASVCAIAQDQDTLAAREAAMDRYFQAVPTQKLVEDSYAAMARQLPAAQRAAFIAEMRRIVRTDVIDRIARAAMIKHFTADELNALADFHSSRHGATATAKYGVYMGEVTPALMQEMQRALRELQATRPR
jgi:hypothetical protein